MRHPEALRWMPRVQTQTVAANGLLSDRLGRLCRICASASPTAATSAAPTSDVTHGRSLAAHLRGRIYGTALRCGELVHRDAPERSFNHERVRIGGGSGGTGAFRPRSINQFCFRRLGFQVQPSLLDTLLKWPNSGTDST